MPLKTRHGPDVWIMAKQRSLMMLKAEKRLIKITYIPTLDEKSNISNFTLYLSLFGNNNLLFFFVRKLIWIKNSTILIHKQLFFFNWGNLHYQHHIITTEPIPPNSNMNLMIALILTCALLGLHASGKW